MLLGIQWIYQRAVCKTVESALWHMPKLADSSVQVVLASPLAQRKLRAAALLTCKCCCCRVIPCITCLFQFWDVLAQIQELAKDNAKFAAVDKAIGKQSLKVVTLLRLSPLLPLALSNYLYGLTSVDLGSYVLGSWLGMLPGTIAYVTVSNVGLFVDLDLNVLGGWLGLLPGTM